MTESARKQEIVGPQPKQEKSVLVMKEKMRPIVIDLDTYEERAEPSVAKVENGEEVESSGMSSELVVREPLAEGTSENGYNAELAVISVDNIGDGEISRSGVLSHPMRNERNGSGAAFIYERLSTGNGNIAPRSDQWEGSPRWASSHVGILTVQCARCLKWRVVPSKEQYEAIREHILEQPWVCENALEWRPDAHCSLPTDLNQDSRSLWAIDKPNLPSSPPGWQRKVIVRKDCSTKFADVYYTAPEGKTLRSMVEVARYIQENPESVPQGTRLNQFSFAIPQPLPGMWTAKKRGTMRSMASLSSPQGEGKRARAPQPLAKQLAQRLLHGANPPSLPMPPHSPLPYISPSSIQPLAMQVDNIPPLPLFSNTSVLPLPPIPLPHIRHLYPNSLTIVSSHDLPPNQVNCFSSQRGMFSASVGQMEPSPSTSACRRKRHQQKSPLGVASSLAQNIVLPGILPLREPNPV